MKTELTTSLSNRLIYYLDRENSKCVADCICQRWWRQCIPSNILYLQWPTDTPSLLLSKTLWRPMKTSGSDAKWLLRLGHKIAMQVPPVLLGYLLLLFIFHAMRKPGHMEKSRCSTQEPQMSSQPIASINHQTYAQKCLQMIPESPPTSESLQLTIHTLWTISKQSLTLSSTNLFCRAQEHNKMVVVCHQLWR